MLRKLDSNALSALLTVSYHVLQAAYFQQAKMASASATGHNALLVSIVLLATVCACTAETPYAAGLSEDFYQKTCPQAASIVDAYVTKFLRKDRNFAGAFNRLQFHDCWVGVRNLDQQNYYVRMICTDCNFSERSERSLRMLSVGKCLRGLLKYKGSVTTVGGFKNVLLSSSVMKSRAAMARFF